MSVFARLAVFTHIMTDYHYARHWTAALTGRGRKMVGFQILVLEVGCIWKMCPKKSVQKGLSKGEKVLQNSPLIPLAVTFYDNCVIGKKWLTVPVPAYCSPPDAPICSNISPSVLGVGEGEELLVPCNVQAHPKVLNFNKFSHSKKNISC